MRRLLVGLWAVAAAILLGSELTFTGLYIVYSLLRSRWVTRLASEEVENLLLVCASGVAFCVSALAGAWCHDFVLQRCGVATPEAAGARPRLGVRLFRGLSSYLSGVAVALAPAAFLVITMARAPTLSRGTPPWGLIGVFIAAPTIGVLAARAVRRRLERPRADLPVSPGANADGSVRAVPPSRGRGPDGLSIAGA